VKNTTKKCGKRVFSLVFLDPSSPRLASGSHGPSNDFRVKEPARLGKLVTSGLSLSSLSQVPFSINRCEGEAEREFQGLQGEGIERREKEEERKKRKRSRGATESRPRSIPTLFLVQCSSCDRRLVFF